MQSRSDVNIELGSLCKAPGGSGVQNDHVVKNNLATTDGQVKSK